MNRTVLLLLLCATATLAQAQDESPEPKTTSKPVAALRVLVKATAATRSVRARVVLTTASKEVHELAEPAKPTGRLLASLAGSWVQVRGASEARALRDVAVEGRARKVYKAGVPIYPIPNARHAPFTRLSPGEVVWCRGGPPGWLVCKAGYVMRDQIRFRRKAPQEPTDEDKDKDEADKPAAKGATGVLDRLGN